jgi:Bacterial pre-peptidase C-terminal domain
MPCARELRRAGPLVRAVVVALAAIVAISAPAADADIVGAGPDETIQQAYGPLAQSVNYTGAFSGPNDVDYLAFEVTSAGESLHFTVSNTMHSCNSPDDDSCPLYATLMDQTNNQVGGDNSSAGTVATFNDTETIDWTFAQPGTYYVLMESNGNLPAGQPTYTVRTGPPPPSGPVVKSITVPRHEYGFSVRGAVVLGQPAASLRTTLFTLAANGRRIFVATSALHSVAAGTYRPSVRLPAFWRHRLVQRHSLPMLLEFTIVMASGSHLSFTRGLTLTP